MKYISVLLAIVCGVPYAEGASAASADVREEVRAAHAGERCIFAKDQGGKPFPKVIIKRDRVEILDDRGNPRNTLARENDPVKVVVTHVYPDRHGKVVGIHTTRGIDPARESWKEGEYYILDAGGHKTLELKPFNDGTHPAPSPSGDYAVGWTTEMGPPLFYDAQGTRNKWSRKWYERAKRGFTGDHVDEWPDMFEAATAWFSPSGNRVAVYGTGPGRRGALVVYDSNGKKLFQADEPTTPLFSHDGNRMAYGKAGKVGIVDMSGNVVWEMPSGWLPAKFSDDGKFLIFRAQEKLAMLDAATGKTIWEWKPSPEKLAELRQGGKPAEQGPLKGDSGLGILLVDATSDFSRIVALGLTFKEVPVWPGKPQRRLTSERDHLLVFDKKGHLLVWKELPGHTFPGVIGDLAISISDDGSEIAVPGSDGVHHFFVKPEKGGQ